MHLVDVIGLDKVGLTPFWSGYAPLYNS